MCMCSSRLPSLPMEPPILPLVKGQSTRWTEQSLPSIKRPPRLPREKARRAEEPGYDTFLVPDHSEKEIAPIAVMMAALDATTRKPILSVLRPKIAKKG